MPESGHHSNRAFFDQSGNLNLNGAQLLDSAGNNQASVVAGATAGLRIAAGEATLDGSNPTSVVTGLSTVLYATVSLKSTSAPGDDPSWVSYGLNATPGTLDIYAWKNTGGTDPTLVASTNSSAVFGWIAVGT